MILDRLEDLKSLADRASNTSVILTEDAAFAEVQQQVTTARLLWVNLGVARTRVLRLLTPSERRSVNASAAQMRQVLEVLANATDDELAAYASTTSEKRGTLSAVLRQARELRGELLSAQETLLRRLAEQIWPETDLLRLDLISHLTDNPSAAEAARVAAKTRQRLMDVLARYDPGLSESEIDQLIAAAAKAVVDAEPLRAESIDDEVLLFWEAAESEEGVPLAMLTTVVRDWLERHNALGSFKVHRTR